MSGGHALTADGVKYLLVLASALILVACGKSDGPLSLQQKTAEATGDASLNPDSWYVSQYCASNEKNWMLEEELPQDPAGGIYEVTRFPQGQPSEADFNKAEQMENSAWQAAVDNGWLNKSKALADGFELLIEDNIHFGRQQFIFDNTELDPARPEFLMYYPTEYGELLMGAMFVSQGRGEQIAGPLSIWHYHIGPLACYKQGLYPVSLADDRGNCVEGTAQRKTIEMLHLWFFDHPEGPFATKMRLPNEYHKQAVQSVLARYKEAGITPDQIPQ